MTSSIAGPLRDLTQAEGRNAFGADPANYDSARPRYPDWVFETLQSRCGLGPETATFEVGPGTGLPTERLLELGAAPLVAIEPDARLAAFLSRKLTGHRALSVINTPFEDAPLEDGRFALGTSATAFHWLDQRAGLAKVARALRPGGWWAAWWNVFGDPDRHDAFHDATNLVLNGGDWSPGQIPFALDAAARRTDIEEAGAFEDIDIEIRKWTLVLDPAQVRALYATYSQFSVLAPDERERILDELARIAAEEFAGRVERNMCTALYTARRA